MVRVWCDAVDSAGAAIGETQGTFDSVGTVTIKKGATDILGIIALCAATTNTAGENGGPVLQVDSQDLGISKQQFVLATGGQADCVGTNTKEVPIMAEFIPFKTATKQSLDNAKVDFSLSTTTTRTAGYDTAIGLVFADGLPDAEFLIELMSGLCGRATGGAVAYMRAGIKAATATAFTTGISVSSAARELIGICSMAYENAPTTVEAMVGITELQASQIADFSPQKWPFIFGMSASLGTPVGATLALNSRNGVYWPTRFPLPQTNFTINVSQWLATALTTEADGVAAIKYR